MLVFISYRRDDGKATAQRIHRRLVRRFGRDAVFMDTQSIPLGAEFPETLRTNVEKCDLLVAVIGPRWETIPDVHGRPRIRDEKDFVRIEVASALELKITVVPVLVDRAGVPDAGTLPDDLKKLSTSQAVVAGLDPRFKTLVRHLAERHPGVRACLGVTTRGRCGRAHPGLFCPDHARQPRRALYLAAAAGLVVALAFQAPPLVDRFFVGPTALTDSSSPGEVLEIREPGEDEKVGQTVRVRGRSPYWGEPHYLVVGSRSGRYVDGGAFYPSAGGFTVFAELGSGAQGLNEPFTLQVVATRDSMPEGDIGANPSGTRASPEVSVFRIR